MSRYTNDLPLNKPVDFVQFMMNDYLSKNGFSTAEWKGQPVYRAGDPMLEGYKFMTWSYINGVLHVEAWLKGLFGGEMGLTGFVGCLQKKPCPMPHTHPLLRSAKRILLPLPVLQIPVYSAQHPSENKSVQAD